MVTCEQFTLSPLMIFSLLHAVDQPFNLYPSLHITYSSLTVFAIIDQTKSRVFHAFLLFWLVLIAFSVVLVHQHHLFDIITGLVLAGIVIKFVYRKLVPKKALFKG